MKVQLIVCLYANCIIVLSNYAIDFLLVLMINHCARLKVYLLSLIEKISEQVGRLMQYFEDQNGDDFDPGKIIMESVANVICRITFGKHFDSSHPDFEELLHLNNKAFTDTEVTSQSSSWISFQYPSTFLFLGIKQSRRS